MTKDKDQYEKDVQIVINRLKQTDPTHATRKHALEILGDMQAFAHLFAHKVVEKERSQKTRKSKIKKK